jgi:hypothetical protein
MNQPKEFDVIQHFEDRTEAELACGLLVSAGLNAQLEEHELLHGFSDSLPIEAAVGLMVPPDQVEDARALLESVRNSGGTLAADTVPENS